MTDVPLSLAIVSTVTPVISGVVPLVGAWMRDAARERRGAAERDRLEEAELARKEREQCLKLLRLSREFRVLVENTYESTGTELNANAELIRQSAAALASQADDVEFMISGAGAEALSLAVAARRLGAPIADKENRTSGLSLRSPDFTEFDRCLEDFKQAAQAALSAAPGPVSA